MASAGKPQHWGSMTLQDLLWLVVVVMAVFPSALDRFWAVLYNYTCPIKAGGVATNHTLSNYAGQGYELAGFVWFQGWNDMINAEYTAEYTTNLGHFIRDVRRDLKAPHLPFVIGQMGVDGANPNANIQRFKATQAAVMEVAEFK